jgi:hypothetical protein
MRSSDRQSDRFSAASPLLIGQLASGCQAARLTVVRQRVNGTAPGSAARMTIEPPNAGDSGMASIAASAIATIRKATAQLAEIT